MCSIRSSITSHYAVIHRFPVGVAGFWRRRWLGDVFDDVYQLSRLVMLAFRTLIGPVARRPIPCLIMGTGSVLLSSYGWKALHATRWIFCQAAWDVWLIRVDVPLWLPAG